MAVTPTPPSAPEERSTDAALRRELYFFTLYRSLEAALFVLLAFSPLITPFAELRQPLFARAVASTYLLAALVLLLAGR